MCLHLVTNRKAKPPLSIVRALSREEEDALRRVKQGIDLPGEDPVYRATVGYAREKRLWILCDCRDGSASDRPAISLVRKENGLIHLSNLPRAEVPHVEGCIFAPGEGARRRMPVIVFRDVLRPVADGRERADGEYPGKGPQRRLTGPGTDSQSSSLAGHLHRLMQAASMHRLSVSEGFASPGEWLAGIRRAAGTFRSPESTPKKIGTADLLFTDPGTWASGHVAKVLARLEPGWPKKGAPFAWLCWMARDIAGCEVNRAHPHLGHVRVLTDPVFPTVMGNRVEGPWLFLGEVGRSPETGRWVCLEACARPIASARCPVPVDSHNERRALGALRSAVWSLENNARLGEALGGAIRIDIEKPLFDIETVGGPCRPDFILTVIRPGCDPADDRHLLGDSSRYIVEVMGLDDPEYESKKAETHRRMRNLGR
ncbi:MAG: hypothetical protein OXE57_08040, partial [Alphaproteobacteria bacterium]|nr:hypothetical protein [Alphaproteobacteria bacterium]